MSAHAPMVSNTKPTEALSDGQFHKLPPGMVYGAFVRGVYLGGFFAWLVLITLIGVTEGVPAPLPSPTVIIIVSGIFGFAYCTAVVLAFFFVPFVVVRIVRRVPDRSRALTMVFAMSSSLAIWLFMAWLIGMSISGASASATWSGITASVVGGGIAGHTFWRRVFPPLADVSDVFQ